jgi:hypothetical protein
VKVASKIFKDAPYLAWPFSVEEISHREIDIDKLDAIGGTLAALFHLSSRHSLVNETYIAAYEGIVSDDLKRYAMLYHAKDFAHGCSLALPEISEAAQMFWSLALDLIEGREQKKFAAHVDVVLAFLERYSNQSKDEAKEKTNRFIDEFKKAVNFGDKSVSELLVSFKKPLARAVLMFALKERVEDLLELNADLLNGEDYAVMAILFGIRDGWMRFSTTLRSPGGLEKAIPWFMAHVAHRALNSNFDLGPVPERPKAFREMFEPPVWSKKMNEAALFLARQRQWACIQSRVRLGKGEYKLVIDGSGANILLDGDVKSVDVLVDRDKLLNKLSVYSLLEPKIDDEVYRLLGVAQ